MRKLVLLIAALALVPASVQGASIVCPTDIGYAPPIADNVTPSYGCEIGGDNNDSVLQVNLDTMFGFDDWQGLDVGSEDFSGGTRLAGTFDFSALDFGAYTVGTLMLVLKDGMDEPENYVGYLIPVGVDIAYTTPFLNTTGHVAKEISHYSLYYREGTTTVPEPATLLLFGTGLIAFAHRFRRR